MYTPRGKFSTNPPQAESENTEKPFVPQTQYDRIIKDEKVYDLRSTSPIEPFLPTPTDAQRADGIILRYFVQHKSSGEVTEVSSETYNALFRKRPIYHYPSYFLGSSRWRLRGPVADEVINGYIVEGASKENEFYIEELQKRLPNIRTYLTDPSQFVK